MGGAALVVSQFTLYADARRGRRPSFIGAAGPVVGERLYEVFCEILASTGVPVRQGRFGADMDVELVNDGRSRSGSTAPSWGSIRAPTRVTGRVPETTSAPSGGSTPRKDWSMWPDEPAGV